MCDSVPFVFVSREPDANIIWFEFTILIFFTFYANFLFFNCVIHYFGLQVHAARLILSLVIVPCLLWGDKRLMLPSPHHFITFNFVVLFEEFTVESARFGDPNGFIDGLCVVYQWQHILACLQKFVFIVFHFIAGARVYAGNSSLSRTCFQWSGLGQSTLLREWTPVALHPLWVVNSIQHTCSYVVHVLLISSPGVAFNSAWLCKTSCCFPQYVASTAN